MERLISDRATAARLAAAGARRALDFDVSAMASAYERLFRELRPDSTATDQIPDFRVERR